MDETSKRNFFKGDIFGWKCELVLEEVSSSPTIVVKQNQYKEFHPLQHCSFHVKSIACQVLSLSEQYSKFLCGYFC